MKTLLAISLATIYGLSARMLFAIFSDSMEIMSISFLMLAPLVIGFVTVSFIKKDKNFNKRKAFFTPWLTSFAILVITILLEVEGLICWIMIYPLFSIVAGIGGIIVYYRFKKELRENKKANDSLLDDLDARNSLKTTLLLLTPFFFGAIEGDRSHQTQEYTITQTVTISAPDSVIWKQLISINQVKPNEKMTPLSNWIGFPQHLKTTLDTAVVGGRRMAYYENGLFFEETILVYEPPKRMLLDVYVDPNKVPPNVMDEHIVIGGKHVDLLEDEYLLEAQGDGTYLLTLSSRFKINTPFNWYAGIWATFLMQDLLNGELQLIKERTLQSLSN